MSLLCGLGLFAWAAAPAQAIVGGTTTTFNYTGAEQTFPVPAGIFGVRIRAIGGTGGDAITAIGGEAAETNGAFSVTPGKTLYVEVGGMGHDETALIEPGEGGFNGGGSGAAGGGGASDVRTLSRATELTTQDTRLIVAAGGGGGGGNGPLENGSNGGNAGEDGANAATYEGGRAGTSEAGGEGKPGCEPQGAGGNGGLGFGGEGGDSEQESEPGGGGGAGLYGGGGGGGACLIGSSGGGGGSSLSEALVILTSAEPMVQITYYPPPTATITSPEDGASYTQGKVVNSGYSCEEGEGTFLFSCEGPVETGAPIDTSTPGTHEFTVTAEDVEHGKGSKTVHYTVVPPPSVSIGSPANSATYTQGQAITATYVCAAAGGATLTSCTGPVANGAPIDTAMLGQHTFTVEAEDSLGGKTSRSVKYTVVAPTAGGPPPSGGSPPNTILGSHPRKTIKTKKKKVKVKFTFSSDVAGATFKCKLDRGAFSPCTSPKTYKVKRGKHTFSVEAVAPGGTDQTPATFRFKVKKKG